MRKNNIAIHSLHLSVLLNIILLLYSCASSGLPTANELSLIQAGEQSIVLLRMKAKLEDGTIVEPFPSIAFVDNMNIGVCSDDPEGEMKRMTSQRFLTPETQKQGWIFLILKPGTHYIAFQGAMRGPNWAWDRQLQYARRWRINIEKGTPTIYAGTINLICRSDWYITGVKKCDYFDESRMVIQNETDLAKKVAAESIPNFQKLQTVLMERYD